MSNRLEQIVKLRFAGVEAETKPVAKEPINLADYPWDTCIADQTERYGDEETAKKVCGAIKAMYGSKEAFVIPTPESGEEEQKYISRCMDAIGSEYDTQEQALAVCYAQLEK